MSASRSSRCIFCTFKQVANSRPVFRRKLHVTPFRAEEKKPEPSDSDIPQQYSRARKLSPEELKENFTPAQAAAIRAAEEDLEQIETQTRFRAGEPWATRYYDDFTEIDPVIDKPVKAPWSNIDESSRLKTEDEFNEEILQFMQNMPANEEEAQKAFKDFHTNMRLTVGKEEAEKNPRSAQAPSIPLMGKNGQPPVKKGIVKTKKQDRQSGDRAGEQEVSPALVRLMQMTGFDAGQLRKLKVKSLITHRVVNQTRLGKISKMYFLSVAGNGNGLLGIGEGKSESGSEAMLQSQYRAIRNMLPVLRYENRTIFGDVEGKSGATELKLYARPPGKLAQICTGRLHADD